MKNRLLFSALLLATACGHPYTQGERLYSQYCASCHMDDGTGLAGVIPPLDGSETLRSDPHRVPCIIRNGMEGPIVVSGRTYNRPMPGIPSLTETETANIINYLLHRWGDVEIFLDPQEVRATWDSCGRDPIRISPFPAPPG